MATYAEAGVSIDAGNALVERIKPLAKATQRLGTMGGIGGFGALFERLVHLLDELVGGQAVAGDPAERRREPGGRPVGVPRVNVPPLVVWLEHDDGLCHRKGRRVG